MAVLLHLEMRYISTAVKRQDFQVDERYLPMSLPSRSLCGSDDGANSLSLGEWIFSAAFSGIWYLANMLLVFLSLIGNKNMLPPRTVRPLFTLPYMSIMFALSTMSLISSVMAIAGQSADSICSAPGENRISVNTLGVMGMVCYVFSNWGADGFLVRLFLDSVIFVHHVADLALCYAAQAGR